MEEKPKFQLPGVGLRNLKTAFSAALCAALYFLIGRNPTFACIGAVYGMGSDMGDSWKQGGNRLIGTVIGGFLGMALFWLYRVLNPSGETRVLLVPLLALGVVVLIVLAQIFQWPTAVQPGSVVLCIILFNTPVDTYIDYAMNRILDTAVGVLLALYVSFVFPRGWMQLWPERLKRMRVYMRAAALHVHIHHPSQRAK